MSIQWNTVVDEYIALLLGDEIEAAVQKTQDLLDSGVSPTEFFDNCASETGARG